MPRYRITLEYDGRPFVGWQRQKNGFAVQEAIETAVERLSGERVTVQCEQAPVAWQEDAKGKAGV